MEGWSVVRKTKPRNYFDMQNEEVTENDANDVNIDDDVAFLDDINITWKIDDIDGIIDNLLSYIAYEGKGMRAVADEMKVIDVHVPK
ncbi:hypothetical protein Taro_041632, partial [Colocasia esculenta]|nr:hypothetical protein [Colocasia esculenta]